MNILLSFIVFFLKKNCSHIILRKNKILTAHEGGDMSVNIITIAKIHKKTLNGNFF